MPATILFEGPLAYDRAGNEGPQWCTVCAMIWKGEAQSALAEQIKAVPDGETKTFSLDKILPGASRTRMSKAVAWGLFQPCATPPMGNGLLPLPVPLCWTHLLPLEVRASSVMPASAGMMPGAGGAVLLGQGG